MEIEVKTIGMIGLGRMGLPMAKNLMTAGYDVVGYRRGDADDFVACGGILAASPRDVAEQCEIIFSCIPDSDALADIVSGPRGIARADCKGKVIVELSTLSTADKLGEASAFEQAGGVMLDGAISGIPHMVADKLAVFYLSGSRTAFEAVHGPLQAMSNKVFFMGPFGAALATKLCANMLVAINIASAAEVLAFGRKLGIEPKDLVDALKDGAGGSLQFTARARRMAVGDWDKVMGSTATLSKDIGLIEEKSREVEYPLSILSAASSIYEEAVGAGYGDRDVASVYAVTAMRAGLTIPKFEATSENQK